MANAAPTHFDDYYKGLRGTTGPAQEPQHKVWSSPRLHIRRFPSSQDRPIHSGGKGTGEGVTRT